MRISKILKIIIFLVSCFLIILIGSKIKTKDKKLWTIADWQKTKVETSQIKK